MNSGNIVITNMEMLHVTKCEYEKRINYHGFAVIEGYLKAEDYEACKEKGSSGEWFAVEEKQGEKSEIVFSGLVQSLTISQEDIYRVKLILQGETVKMDMTENTRIFQDGSNTLEAITSKIIGKYGAGCLISSDFEEPISHMVVQYEETDWEFLKRMASELGGYLIPYYKTSGCRSMIGIEERTGVDLSDSNYMVRNIYFEYEKKSENGVSVNTDDQIEYIVNTREVLQLGDAASINGKALYVYGAEGKWEGEELIHSYTLRSKKGFLQQKVKNESLIGATFQATVEGVENDRIEVSFDAIEAYGSRKYAYATVYSTKTGAGWYSMPEKEDAVRIIFPTEEPEEAYASSAVHLSMGSADANTKFIKNPYNKEIRFSEHELRITNNTGMDIILDDEKGLILNSNKNITISAAKELNLSSEAEKITVQGQQGVELLQGESKIEVNNEVKLIAEQVHVQNVE